MFEDKDYPKYKGKWYFYYFNIESDDCNFNYTKESILDILMDKFSPKKKYIEVIKRIPLIPNEGMLWDDKLIPFSK